MGLLPDAARLLAGAGDCTASSLGEVDAEAIEVELSGLPGDLALRVQLLRICGLSSFSVFAHITKCYTQYRLVKETESAASWGKYEGPRANQPTKVYPDIFVPVTFDFNRKINHGYIRPDPHETRTSRVTWSVAGWV